MPGRLFEEVLERLYREDRLAAGTLEVGGRRAGQDRLRGPVLAVAKPPGRVVPSASILDGLAAMPPDVQRRVLQYEGERGPALQHLGPLVGPDAHRRPLLHRHKPCGHLFDPVMVCSECIEPLKAREVIVEPGFRSEGGGARRGPGGEAAVVQGPSPATEARLARLTRRGSPGGRCTHRRSEPRGSMEGAVVPCLSSAGPLEPHMRSEADRPLSAGRRHRRGVCTAYL
jgi:hypothetical protein